MGTEITKDSLKKDIFKAYQKSYGETVELNKLLEKRKEEIQDLNSTFINLTGVPAESRDTLTEFETSEVRRIINEHKRLRQLFPEIGDFTKVSNEELLGILYNEIGVNSNVIQSQATTVVIPYIKEFAQANELQLALRGWDKHFKHEMNVVIIGDREPWMNNLVGVIECDRIGNNPPLDVVNKMQLAIDSDLVSEKFIWANDDQYLNTPCILADFETLKGVGHLGNKFGASTYQQNKKRTAELLAELELGNWDFSSHTPIVYEKEKLAELIEKFELKENAYLVQSLYFNYFYPDFVPYNVDAKGALLNDNIKAGVYRVGADLGLLQQLIPQKKLLSNSESGWSEALQKILEKRLPEKCRFEQ